jgi:hypothetical protein
MNVYVSQAYIETGSAYPFSHHFQRFISREITARVSPSEYLTKKFGEEYNIKFRMSAKSAIPEVEVRGPTVFRDSQGDSTEACYRALEELLCAIINTLSMLQFDVSRLADEYKSLITHVMSEPKMLGVKRFGWL